MNSGQESDASGLSFDDEDDFHNENESDIELAEEEEDNVTDDAGEEDTIEHENDETTAWN